MTPNMSIPVSFRREDILRAIASYPEEAWRTQLDSIVAALHAPNVPDDTLEEALHSGECAHTTLAAGILVGIAIVSMKLTDRGILLSATGKKETVQ